MIHYIADGATNQTAAVKNNRLLVTATSSDESKQAALDGGAFNINTGNITLTNAAKSAVLYFKNNGDVDLIIDTLFYILGTSTGGAGNFFIEVVRNPTTGTIITNAIPVSININRNFGSNNVISGTAYKGATGYTFTDGSDAIGTLLISPTTLVVAPGSIILKKGSSIGVNMTPATGNTSQVVQFALSVYERQD